MNKGESKLRFSLFVSSQKKKKKKSLLSALCVASPFGDGVVGSN